MILPSLYTFLVLILVSFSVDILFTVGILLKSRRYYKNPEILEINYHRYFFRKFGLRWGSVYSSIIIIPFFSACIVFMYHLEMYHLLWVILGMSVSTAHRNVVSYYSFEDIRNRLRSR